MSIRNLKQIVWEVTEVRETLALVEREQERLAKRHEMLSHHLASLLGEQELVQRERDDEIALKIRMEHA